jgi:glycosyltransferase involved in cell wall biosynthesis
MGCSPVGGLTNPECGINIGHPPTYLKDFCLSHDPPSRAQLRVLMISKACVVGAYQRKLEEIACHSDVALTVIVPPAWKDARGMLGLERAYTSGYRLLAEPIRFNGNFHLHYFPTLARRAAEIRPDIVHIDEEPYNFAAYHALRIARRHAAKSLFFSWQNIDRRYPPPFGLMERWVLDHADYGLAGTADAADVWRRKGYRGPLAVIPQFGVDPEIFKPGAGQRDHFVIGYAGRLVPEKGLDLLIRAALGLPGKWLIRLAGDGPQRGSLAGLAGVLNIGGSLEFIGSLPSTAMPDFYRGLDALVLPARALPNWKEQFGRMLIEGMACGVPVVGARSGAIPEVIGQAGLTFAEGDVEGLRACLASLIEHPRLREQLANAGRERVLAHYTQAQVAARTVEVYRELAGRVHAAG